MPRLDDIHIDIEAVRPAGPDITLPVEQFTCQRALSTATLTTGRIRIGRAAEDVVVRVDAAVATEHLPDQEFPIATQDPRWASWWDHWKATYRDRWWARTLVRRWPPRTVMTTVRSTVNVRARWQYPDTPLNREGLGRPVVYTQTEQVWRG